MIYLLLNAPFYQAMSQLLFLSSSLSTPPLNFQGENTVRVHLRFLYGEVTAMFVEQCSIKKMPMKFTHHKSYCNFTFNMQKTSNAR